MTKLTLEEKVELTVEVRDYLRESGIKFTQEQFETLLKKFIEKKERE